MSACSSGSTECNGRTVTETTDEALAVQADVDLNFSILGQLSFEMKFLPAFYELIDAPDLVVVITNMIMELIHINDKIPLHPNQLTRFHSQYTPQISVLKYLQRLATHTNLSPPILLSMVYLIGQLCVIYPALNVNSLTVHRFFDCQRNSRQ